MSLRMSSICDIARRRAWTGALSHASASGHKAEVSSFDLRPSFCVLRAFPLAAGVLPAVVRPKRPLLGSPTCIFPFWPSDVAAPGVTPTISSSQPHVGGVPASSRCWGSVVSDNTGPHTKPVSPLESGLVLGPAVMPRPTLAQGDKCRHASRGRWPAPPRTVLPQVTGFSGEAESVSRARTEWQRPSMGTLGESELYEGSGPPASACFPVPVLGVKVFLFRALNVTQKISPGCGLN